MSAEHIVCVIRYLVKGVAPERDHQHALQDELHELLPNAEAVTVLPVVDGFSVEIEMSDLRPFSRTSFEPYLAEHVLPEAVSSRCRSSGNVQLQLLKAHYA
jgi:hypothetical protein